jgi:WD40 repeat protein
VLIVALFVIVVATITAIVLRNNASGPTVVGTIDALGPVSGLAYDSDGRVLALIQQDGSVLLVDVSQPASPSEVGTLRADNTKITAIAFSASGRSLVTGEANGQVQVWYIGQPGEYTAIAQLAGQHSAILAVAISLTGGTVAAGGADRSVELWNLSPGSSSYTSTADTEAITSLAFSPDGRTLASGSQDGSVRVFSVGGGTPITLSGHSDEVSAVVFSPEGNTLADASFDGTARLWDVTGGQPTLSATISGPGGALKALALSRFGTRLAMLGGTTVSLWDISLHRAPTLQRTMTVHDLNVNSLVLSPDGTVLALGGTGVFGPAVELWQV